jgi:formylglycine-generating enzyme required for sulfatase activity
MVMVYVPAGSFLMGAGEDDSNALRDEHPEHFVTLDSFWIDRTEVTNSQYADCVDRGVCRIPYSGTSFSRNPYYENPEYADFPVVFVSWNDAGAYCGWAERRLPTEAEWEYAARGQDGRIYPWGDELACDFANYRDCLGDTENVMILPLGASPFGALNMAGNVWEWVSDWYYFAYYDLSPPKNPPGPVSGAYRVIRGGSFYDDPVYMRTSSRYWLYPDQSRFSVGFRCVVNESP